MDDKIYYQKLDSVLTEFMRQAGNMTFQDYGMLNEVLMESSRRLKETTFAGTVELAKELNLKVLNVHLKEGDPADLLGFPSTGEVDDTRGE